jgi:hypothetical protein
MGLRRVRQCLTRPGSRINAHQQSLKKFMLVLISFLATGATRPRRY